MYNLRNPVSQKASYKSGDNIDFVLSFPNMALVGNSVRLSGTLDAYTVGTTRPVSTSQFYFDGATGIHAFFNNIVVDSQLKGILENESNYPRWVKMKNTATRSASQMMSNSRMLTQLVTGYSQMTNSLMAKSMPFYMELDCCLNNVAGSVEGKSSLSSNGSLPYSKFGDITISLRVAQVVEALFGAGVTATANFTISNFACEYMTVPETKDMPPVNMLISQSVKQVINSVNSTINVKLPAIVSRVSASFMRVAEELSLTDNNLELEQPLGVSKVYYSFNDSTNAFISYPLESLEDMLEHYLDSFINDDRKNDATLAKIQASNFGKFFGLGLNFESGISLQNTSFGLNIQSNVQSSDGYYAYLYFKSLLSV
jgi:hypothetical protein